MQRVPIDVIGWKVVERDDNNSCGVDSVIRKDTGPSAFLSLRTLNLILLQNHWKLLKDTVSASTISFTCPKLETTIGYIHMIIECLAMQSMSVFVGTCTYLRLFYSWTILKRCNSCVSIFSNTSMSNITCSRTVGTILG